MKTQRNNPKSARRGGFTLVEVLLVLAIIGVIAAMVVPNLIGTQQRANIQATRIKIKSTESAFEMYAGANAGEFPQGSRDDVMTMMTTPTQDADGRTNPAFLSEYPKDPWQEILYYEFPTSKKNDGKPAIWSSGPNKTNEEGSGDDVNNWVK